MPFSIMKHNNAFSIHLTQAQVDQVNAWIGAINSAHLGEECEPPGFELVVSFAGPYGQWVTAQCGSSRLELGEVTCEPMPGGWAL